MRKTRRSQCTLRAKALSMEAFFRAEAKISRARSRMRANCCERWEEISAMVQDYREGVALLRSGDNSAHPGLNGFAHLAQAAFKEMIARLNANQLLGLSEGVDQGFKFSSRPELVTGSADKEFGFFAIAQELEIVDAIFNGHRRKSEANQRGYARIVVGGAQPDGGSEREARKNDRQREFAFEPIEANADIFDFANAFGMLAFA